MEAVDRSSFLANTESYDLSAEKCTKKLKKLKSSLTSGGFSEVLYGNQESLHLHWMLA